MNNDEKEITQEEKEEIEKSCKRIVENFPIEKYQQLVEALEKVMSHPKMKGAVIKYLEEISK